MARTAAAARQAVLAAQRARDDQAGRQLRLSLPAWHPTDVYLQSFETAKQPSGGSDPEAVCAAAAARRGTLLFDEFRDADLEASVAEQDRLAAAVLAECCPLRGSLAEHELSLAAAARARLDPYAARVSGMRRAAQRCEDVSCAARTCRDVLR
jgi:hypothetical protein